uniref:Uncharacterized protein n=1 Tax=Myotis myotis TaxID=51298 RepID=A0A7J7VIJ0_MYOMY|nr:hypothetical protein mMyoMyo1_008406 [Myotis myotis]
MPVPGQRGFPVAAPVSKRSERRSGPGSEVGWTVLLLAAFRFSRRHFSPRGAHWIVEGDGGSLCRHRVREQEGVRGRQTGKAESFRHGRSSEGRRQGPAAQGKRPPESLGSTADGQPPLKRWGPPRLALGGSSTDA